MRSYKISLSLVHVAIILSLSTFGAAADQQKRVMFGNGFACSVNSGKTELCAGDDTYGSLGTGAYKYSDTPLNVQYANTITQVNNFIATSTGQSASHACGIDVNANLWCWGYNSNGQLGNGTITNSVGAVKVSGISNVKQVVVGGAHTCALTTLGDIYCWGAGTYGQLGLGYKPSANVYFPTKIQSGATKYSTIAAGAFSTCAVNVTGGVQCWGRNGSALGDGLTSDRMSPTNLVGYTSGVSDIAMGGVYCIILTSGSLKCWGSGANGLIGNGLTGTINVPTQVVGLTSNVTQVSVSSLTACAVMSNALYCWGQYVGDGTTYQRNSPVKISGSNYLPLSINIGFVAVGGGGACAAPAGGGTLYCWGRNGFGQLGLSMGLVGTTIPTRSGLYW